MKKVILSAALSTLLVTAAQAASITWQANGVISGPADVVTQGIYFGSWAPFNGGANAAPVNGVTFQGNSDLPSLIENFPSGGGGAFYGQQNTPDGFYNGLLSYGIYAGDGLNASFSWSGMTEGNTYLIQLWVGDTRNLGQTRWENLSGDSGASSPDLFFPADGSGNGQFAIGTFVADASGTQIINIDPSSSTAVGSAQVNLFQVRDLGVVPEPGTASLLLLSLAGLVARRRRAGL